MNTRVTIEEINGEPHTVVWHDCFSGSIGMAMEHGYWRPLYTGFVLHNPQNGNCDATALHALPRHPTPSDAKLLYAYMAQGINIRGDVEDMFGRTDNELLMHFMMQPTITHALNEQGERVEIAIRGDV